jgi:hypothetical protein
VLSFYEQDGEALFLPRGFARQLLYLCKRYNVEYRLTDERRILPEVDFRFQSQLCPFQFEAVGAMMSKDFGTLSAPTGSGKTFMALYIVARRYGCDVAELHVTKILGSLERAWRVRCNVTLTKEGKT